MAPLPDLLFSQPPLRQESKREAWSDDIGVAQLKQEKLAPRPQELPRICQSDVQVSSGVNQDDVIMRTVSLRLEALLDRGHGMTYGQHEL